MAGYSGYSKSNNALLAERAGKFPASVLAKKLGVPAAAVRSVLSPAEAHHTSKRYNLTHYYDGEYLLKVRAGEPKPVGVHDAADFEQAEEDMAALRSWRPAAQPVTHKTIAQANRQADLAFKRQNQ